MIITGATDLGGEILMFTVDYDLAIVIIDVVGGRTFAFSLILS